MSLTPGTRLGPYEILSALGAGGMGEVYRARDTRLDRTVAIKILPETLAADPQFRERFDREARTISQLDHPNICTLHDVGDQDGTAFLVMQFLEGETLEARLKKGALPLEQALIVAVQMAGALDKAHRAGIVHRDLKPGNIMLMKSGAKLLDFGLAKANPAKAGLYVPAGDRSVRLPLDDARGRQPDGSMLPTTPPNLTAQGTILGTFQYMAPEQLEGQEADARTDIFAFGAVLYETLTGRKAFTGKTQASLIGAILKDEPPPVSAEQPVAPPALERIVKTCLAKDPDDRWQTTRDLLRELRWVAEGSGAATVEDAPHAKSVSRRERLSWIGALVVTTAIAGAGVYLLTRPPRIEPPSAIRFQVLPPVGLNFITTPASAAALSPDGRRIVFPVTGNDSRGNLLAIRMLDTLESRVLAGTEGLTGGGLPFWSPDSRFVGFSAQGKLKKIDVTGGPSQVLCDAVGPAGGTWNSDGTIVFAPNTDGGLFRVSSAGGTPTRVTTPDTGKQERFHRYPWFLPDGRHFLYVALSSASRIYIGSIDSTERTELVASDSRAFYGDGHILFVRQSTLLAQRFDAVHLRLTGESFPVAENLSVNAASGGASLSVSATGVLAYRTGTMTESSQLVWVDRSGKQLGTVGAAVDQTNLDLSPDGKRVAVSVLDPVQNTRDIAIYDLTRSGLRTRFTFDAADEFVVAWSPDGGRLAFNSNRKGRMGIYVKASNGAGPEDLLLDDPATDLHPRSWSPDGRFLVYVRGGSYSPTFSTDIWAVPLFGDKKPLPVVQTSFSDVFPRFSPDGRWIAYVSNESGRNEVFVVPFSPSFSGGSTTTALTGKWQVSVAGGLWPIWSRGGKELFYVSDDNKLMAASVNAQGASFEVSHVRSLFEVRIRRTGWLGWLPSPNYDVSADGQQFLVNTVTKEAAPAPITVVVNWQEELKQRVPTK